MATSLLEVCRVDFAHSVVIVDGRTLDYIESAALGDLFFNLALATDLIICYKTSPVQRLSLLKQIHGRITGLTGTANIMVTYLVDTFRTKAG